MKKIKRVLALFAVLALAAGIFSACSLFPDRDTGTGTETGPSKTETDPAGPDESETETNVDTGDEPAGSELDPGSEMEKETGSEHGSEPESTTGEETGSAELPTAEELEEFLSAPGNNGFLTSTYSDVRDASLREVIYQLSDDEIPYEDVVSVLEKKHGHELISSVSYISAEGLQALVLARTGRSLDEFRCDLSDCYLNDEDLDLYYIEHGDTNMQPVKVLEVGEESGKIVVRYTTSFGSDWFWINEGEGYGTAPEMEVVLTRSADGYRFVSNQPAA